jgi:hypothetical protein
MKVLQQSTINKPKPFRFLTVSGIGINGIFNRIYVLTVYLLHQLMNSLHSGKIDPELLADSKYCERAFVLATYIM